MKRLLFLLWATLRLLLLLLLLLLAGIAKAADASKECPAHVDDDAGTCTIAADPPVVYIRDSPLHTELVRDTLQALQHPTAFPQKKKKARYFEGWYYKIDLPHDRGTFVVIPGLYLHAEDPHGFVMILDASTEDQAHPECRYYRVETSVELILEHSKTDGDHDFVFWLDPHIVFTAHGFTIQLAATTTYPAIQAQASWTPLPLSHTTRWNPTIMGWFSWLPRGWAQCSHGVVSMDHSLASGSATVGEKVVSLEGARGYIEKDWGREFPERYTWIQANDFVVDTTATQQKTIVGASFLVSVASIPVKPFEQWWEFQGFLSFLRYPDANGIFRVIRLATYTGAKANYTYQVTTSPLGIRQHTVVVTLTSSRHVLVANVTGDRDGAATLWGPLPTNPSGGMKPYVREMLNCPVRVVLTDRKSHQVLFDGTAQHGGFEIEGQDK